MRVHGTGLVRAVALALLCGLALLLGAGQAFAHTRLLGSDPADGASTASAPERVSLRFNEEMQAEFSQVTVTGPDGTAWQTGAVTAEGATVSIGLRPLGPAGRYEVGYRVVSDDGHPVTGAVAFELTAPGPGAAAAQAPAAAAQAPAAAAQAPAAAPAQAVAQTPVGGSGSPVWPWIVGAVVLVACGVTAALRLGKT